MRARGFWLLHLQAHCLRAYTILTMHSGFRTYLALFLALLLVLTGQSMAIARGFGGPAGEMVLCTGSGPVMVYVDENGAPTKPPHYCPDGVLSLLVDMPAPDPMLLPLIMRSVALPGLTPALIRLSSLLRATARAPPRPV